MAAAEAEGDEGKEDEEEAKAFFSAATAPPPPGGAVAGAPLICSVLSLSLSLSLSLWQSGSLALWSLSPSLRLCECECVRLGWEGPHALASLWTGAAGIGGERRERWKLVKNNQVSTRYLSLVCFAS